MADYSFKLPDLGEGIVESEIAEWYVKVGDKVEEDQTIADVMTDKAMVEVTSPVTGIVKSLACKSGEVLAVGSELILFLTDTEQTKEPLVVLNNPESILTDAQNLIPDIQPMNKALGKNHILASPSVRRRAREENIDLTRVTAKDPTGRISNTDIENYIAASKQKTSSPTSINTTQIKIKGLRRVIAQKMSAASRDIPHYSYVEEVDVTELEVLRQYLNLQRQPEQSKLTLLPFIMRAIVKAIPDFPHCNAHYESKEELLTQYDAIHIGIATMTKNGLLVPVITNSESLDIWQAAAKLQLITQRTRDGKAQNSELSGSTITITSLGSIGGISTTPIINAPETTIIGVNKIQEKPVVHNGQIAIRKIMNLSSSFDHRIVDGFDGAQFIQSLKLSLETPATLLL